MTSSSAPSDPSGTVPALPFVTRVQVEGYRSISACDVALGPLTVLVGPNAAGKSNFLDAMHFVVDALAGSVSEAVTSRGGLAALLHSRADGTAAESFRVRLELAPFAAVPADSAAQQLRGARPAQVAYELVIGSVPDRNGGQRLAVLEERLTNIGESGSALLPPFERRVQTDGSTVVFDGPLPLELLPVDGVALPVLASAMHTYRDLWERLVALRFYDLQTPALRALDETQPEQRPAVLGETGQHLGHILGLLAAKHPDRKRDLDGWLRALIPGLLGMDERRYGPYSTVLARFWSGDTSTPLPLLDAVRADRVDTASPDVAIFEREQLSEGTLRASGVLTALFQPGTADGTTPLVAVEEPEEALYPAKLGSLFAALAAASRETQVLVTTQSPDLLDDPSATADTILVVTAVGGATRIGPLAPHIKAYLADDPSQLPDLHRRGQFRSEPPAEEGA